MNISPEIISPIDDIKSDKTHGATELGRQAVDVLKTAAERSQTKSAEEFLEEQKEIGKKLTSTRPTMAPIFNIVSRLLNEIAAEGTRLDLNSIRQLTITRADELVSDSLQAVARIARYGSELITNGDKILTHSYSSTVVAVLKEAFSKYRSIEVIVTRSGSGRTGERIAQELAPHSIPVTFIDDTAVGLYLPLVSKVILGADRICADGKVVNGVGSYQLALASDKANIPLYFACDTLKFDPQAKSDEVDLEDKEPSEVVEPMSLPPGVRVKNPHFDITPLELITGIVTEAGLMSPAAFLDYLRKLPPS